MLKENIEYYKEQLINSSEDSLYKYYYKNDINCLNKIKKIINFNKKGFNSYKKYLNDYSVIVELMINYNNMDCININKQDEIYLLKQNKDYLEKLFNDVIEDYKDAIYRENTYNKASEEYKDYTNCLYFFISLKERMLSLKELNTHFFTKEKTQSFINRY